MRFKLYKNTIRSQRSLWYPKGIIEFQRIVQQNIDLDGNDSLAGILASRQNLALGATYITVPMDCPEDIAIDDLKWGQFYIETPQSVDDERFHGELETVSQTNEAIVELIELGTHVGITQIGRADNLRRSFRAAGHSFVVIDDVGYCVLDSGCDRDTIFGALTDPLADLRFVSKVVVPGPTSGTRFLGEIIENLTFVAASIFDYMGYLQWWPTPQSQEDKDGRAPEKPRDGQPGHQ